MADEPDVQPAAPASEPEEEGVVEGPEEASKVPFGDVLDFGGDLVGWTVVGEDPKSGEVIISKRRGEEIERRTIPREEYDAALERRKTRPGRRVPKPKFRLNQAFGLARGNARVIGYDGATGTVQVEVTIDGRPVRTWVNRGVVNEAATTTSPLAERAFLQEVNAAAAESPQPVVTPTAAAPVVSRAEEAAPAPETQPVAETPALTPVAAPLPAQAAPTTQVASPSVPEKPRSIREELRERRERTDPTKAYVRSLRQEIRDVDKQITDLRRTAPSDPRRAELERYREVLSTDMDIVQTRLEDATRIQQLSTKREALTREPFVAPAAGGPVIKGALIEAGQSMSRLQIERSNLTLQPDFRLDTNIQARFKGISDQMRQVTAIATQAQQSPASAQAEMTLRIRGTAAGGGGAAAGAALGALAGVAAAGAAAQAAAAQAGNAAEAVARARYAIQGINALIADRQNALDAVRGELGQLTQEISTFETQLGEARKRGAPPQEIREFETLIEDRTTARRTAQDIQLSVQVELTGLKSDQQSLESAVVNVEQAGPSPSPVLVGQLIAITPPVVIPPEGIPATAPVVPEIPVAAPVPAPAVAPPLPTAPRRYATGLPAAQAAPPAPTGRRAPSPGAAPSFRQRLTQRLGLPFAFASALTLNVEQQAARRASEEGVGADTYEQALATEGGEAPIEAAPSYTTQVPSEEEIAEEDVYEGGLGDRQRAAAEQQRMAQARESFLPSEGQPQAGLPPVGAPAGAPAPGRPPRAAPPPQARPAAPVVGQQQQAQAAAQINRQQLQAGAAAATRAPGKAGAAVTIPTKKGVSPLLEGTKLGELLTAESIVTVIMLVLEMNAQVFNKYISRIEIIPPQSKVEDVLTAWIDINLLIIGIAPFIIPVAILAVLAIMIIGVGGGIAAVAA